MGLSLSVTAKKLALILALTMAAALLIGCGYAKEVTVSDQRSAPRWSPRPGMYGGVATEIVVRSRKATGWRAFPDGGVPLVLEYKVVFHQVDKEGHVDRIVGEAEVKPVRGTDRGNLEELLVEWASADEVTFRIVNGYRIGGGPVAETSGRLKVEPLP